MSDNVETKVELTEEEKNRQRLIYESAVERIKALNLYWSFRSIDYLVNTENISINQLRGCYFKNKDGEVRANVEKAIIYILKAGMIKADTITPEVYKALDNIAFDILENWRKEVGNVSVMHILLIDKMEKEHFFSLGRQELDILEYLISENLQKDLVMKTIATNQQTKLAQLQAIQS